MRVVDQAAMPPHRCAVVPFISNSNAKAGFIDTGVDLDRQRVYISRAEGCVQLAQAIGWHPPAVVREKDAEIAALQARVEQLEAELAESNRTLDAIEFIGRGPMKPYKKPGRPKKETV